MEPIYVADNEYVDAFAIAWLLQEDHLFFNDDEIGWNGKHHTINGMQLNAANIDDIPIFASRASDFLPGIIDFFGKLEQQENLTVPRKSIHRSLYPAIREGDLTGLTLFNLLACAKALMINRKDNNTYLVIHDTNLSMGIPKFSELVGNLILFMREYNEISGDFTVAFAGSRNFDFIGAFLKGKADAVSKPVAGASVEPIIELQSGFGYSYTNDEGKRIDTKPSASKGGSSKKSSAGSKGAKAAPKKGRSSKTSPSAAASKKSVDYDAGKIDRDIADLVACSLIFDGSFRTSKWVSEFIPQVGDSSSAKNYLSYLESIGAVKNSGNGKYKASTNYEGYVGACLDEQAKEIESESFYELILETLVDYDDFAKLDELLVSVEGLPKRDAVRALLLKGARRGDLEQKGRNLAFRCILDDGKKAEWKSGKSKRAKQRKSDLAEISKKKIAAKEGGSEYKAAYQRYEDLLRAKQVAEIAAEEKAREEQRIADMKDIDLIVEKLEGYKLGTGFVDAKWVKESIKSIKAIKRAQELLDIAWKEGRIRRNVKDKGFIYARLLSEDEWDAKLQEAKSGFEQSFKEKVSKLAAEHDKRISDERRALTQKVKEADSATEQARRDANAAQAKADKLKADYERKESAFNETASQIESLDEQIAALDSEAAALESELGSLGLFAFSKKSEVKRKIGDVKSRSWKLVAEKKRVEADRDQAQQAYEKSSKEYHAAELDVDSKKSAITVAESKASNESAALSAFESRPTNVFDAESVKLSDEDLLGRMESLAAEWGAPVTNEWLSSNVEGVSSNGVAVKLLASPAGKSIFAQLDSGLYVVEHSEPKTTTSAPKGSVSKSSSSTKATKPRFASNASCAGRVPTSVKPGKRVKFGNYAFGPYGLNSGKKTMYWTILEVDQNSGYALLLSDSSVCHRNFAEGKGMRKAEWPDCKLAEWLDSGFKTSAFTATERTEMASCPNTGNPFILSADEFVDFKKSPGIKPVEIPYQKTSKYSREQYTEKCWLRSTADKGTKSSVKITYVTENNGLSRTGTTAGSYMGVRPAIWVDASEVAKNITE